MKEDFFVYQLAFVHNLDAPVLGKIVLNSILIESAGPSMDDEFKAKVALATGTTDMIVIYVDDMPIAYYRLTSTVVFKRFSYEDMKLFRG